MQYEGKLYAKISKDSYVPLLHDTDDFDAMHEALEHTQRILNAMPENQRSIVFKVLSNKVNKVLKQVDSKK